MAAILNISKTLKKSPAHLHIVGNVIVKFESFLTLSFRVFVRTKNFGVDLALAAILKFGSIFKKSLAHPRVVRNVMKKIDQTIFLSF